MYYSHFLFGMSVEGRWVRGLSVMDRMVFCLNIMKQHVERVEAFIVKKVGQIKKFKA